MGCPDLYLISTDVSGKLQVIGGFQHGDLLDLSV